MYRSPSVGQDVHSVNARVPEVQEVGGVVDIIHIEFFVEPFKEGTPGPHVEAAVAAFADAGLQPEVGPFATTATGDIDQAAAATSAMVREALQAGATRIVLRLERDPDDPATGGTDAA